MIKNLFKDPKRTTQDSVPYLRVYEKENLIEVEEGYFTRSYLLSDINFSTAQTEDKEDMFIKFGSFLNQFDNTIKFQITINNKNIDIETFEDDILFKYKNDGYDVYREEYNNMIRDKMREGKNNLTQEKYLTIGVEADSAEVAATTLNRIDTDVVAAVRRIGGSTRSSSARLLRIEERLSILYDIYNSDDVSGFAIKPPIVSEERKFTFEDMRMMGLTTKDLIAPMSMEFKQSHFKLGQRYGAALFFRNLPTYLGTGFLADIADSDFNQLLTMNYEVLPADKAKKMVSQKLTSVNAEILGKQKKASQSGYDFSLLMGDTYIAKQDIEELMSDLSGRNQNLFLMSWTLVVFADTKEELNEQIKAVITKGKGYLVDIKVLDFQQEATFAQALPLGRFDLKVNRTMTTESASVFMPFNTQELLDANGIYYGTNATSKNLIMFNRKEASNQNGFILGVPGSGKSFIAKNEMLGALLNTDDDVIVIDPEGEYEPLANLLGGEVVPISIGSEYFLNPLDITLDYATEEVDGPTRDPIPLKSDFIISIMDVIAGNQYSGLSPIQKSVIDRAVRLSYRDYIVYLNSFLPGGINEGLEPDKTKAPTLVDFRKNLQAQKEHEAKALAVALESYTDGSLNIFSRTSNVDINSRFTVFDIKDIGANIKTLAMLVVLDAVWAKIIENRKKGRRTWLYIDEIYILFENEESSKFLTEIWKRARKWGGIPTGITQNVEDILKSETARTMISNSEFVLMLNQAPLDRKQLANMLDISETQTSYITNSSPGQGLIRAGGAIVPFENKFPKDTELYRVMTTKIEEVRRKGEQDESK